MSYTQKIFLAISVFFAILLFSGCGQQKTDTNSTGGKSQAETKTTKENENYANGLPKPTGNPEDAVSAALNEIESEKSDVALEEQETLTSLDDASETDNLKNTYDENEF